MNPLSAWPAQAQVPQAPAAVQPKVVVQTPPKGGGVEQKRAPEAKVDAAGEAAATAAKARAEVNMEQYARATKEVMQVAAQQIQGYLKDSGRNLNVTLDESTGKYVARVVNPETGEVVRSLPSEETLRIARNIDQMRGMLVNQRA